MTTASTETRPGPLIDILGRSWEVDTPVLTAVFDDSTSAVAFALDGGDVALARCDGDDIPIANARTNADGVLEITPNEQPPNPLMRVLADARPGISLAADAHGGFLGGDHAGGLFSIGKDGQIAEQASPGDGPIDCVAASPQSGLRACAIGQDILVYGARFDQPLASFRQEQAVSALSFDPKGKRLAAAHEGGLTLWQTDRPDGTAKTLPRAGAHTAIAWSPDNRFIAACAIDNTIHAWRLRDGADFNLSDMTASPTDLAWARKSRFLVSAGDSRVVCWPIGGTERKSHIHARKFGIPSDILVTGVACHPHNDTIAAGYANGAVLLYRFGKAGELFVKGPGDGAVNTVAWSADGRHLGVGTAEGFVAVVSFPAGFFK